MVSDAKKTVLICGHLVVMYQIHISIHFTLLTFSSQIIKNLRIHYGKSCIYLRLILLFFLTDITYKTGVLLIRVNFHNMPQNRLSTNFNLHTISFNFCTDNFICSQSRRYVEGSFPLSSKYAIAYGLTASAVTKTNNSPISVSSILCG